VQKTHTQGEAFSADCWVEITWCDATICRSIQCSISQEVARKRDEILEIKNDAKERERRIKAKLSDLKRQIKAFDKKSLNSEISSVSKNFDLLKKIKEAYDMGILTDAEYEAKRSALVADIRKDIGVPIN
jgi:Short C-terminal domain